jgi:hypothetical protein
VLPLYHAQIIKMPAIPEQGITHPPACGVDEALQGWEAQRLQDAALLELSQRLNSLVTVLHCRLACKTQQVTPETQLAAKARPDCPATDALGRGML